MAADVSSSVNSMNRGDGKEPASAGKSTVAPITMDLLPGCCTFDSEELDLDLPVPCGWEKRLDLKSGKIYLERHDSSTKPLRKFEDLNFPLDSKRTSTPSLLDEASLDLRLVISSPSTSACSGSYQSVCTLDKVRSALERAEKDTNVVRKRSMSIVSKSPSISNSSSSIKLESDCLDERDEKSKSPSSFAAGCPDCLMYVLVSIGDPKCPWCNCDVPLPTAAKKARIDLNVSM